MAAKIKPNTIGNEAGQNRTGDTPEPVKFSSNRQRPGGQQNRRRRDRKSKLLQEDDREHNRQTVVQEKLARAIHKLFGLENYAGHCWIGW